MTKRILDIGTDGEYLTNVIAKVLSADPRMGLYLSYVDDVVVNRQPIAIGRVVMEPTSYVAYNRATKKVKVGIKAGLGAEEASFHLMHELFHIALGHYNKKGGQRENIAGDLAINSILKQWLKPEYNLLTPDRYKLPWDRTTEWYLENLPEELGEDGEAHQIVIEGTKGVPSTKDLQEYSKRLRDKMVASQEIIGREKYNEEVSSEDDTVPTRSKLNSLRPVPSRPSRSRISRRYGLPPGRKSARQQDINIIIDNSGSVQGEALNRFMEDIKMFKPRIRQLIGCDNGVNVEFKKVKRITKHMIDQLINSGGGGTRFSPAVDAIEKRNITTLYYTDLELVGEDWEDVDRLHKMIWIAWGGRQSAPWGKVVEMGN